MKFILYLLYCIGSIFGIYVGGSNNSYKEAIIGLVVVALIVGVYFLIVPILLRKPDYSLKKSFIVAFLIELGIVVVFSLICILIEFLMQ